VKSYKFFLQIRFSHYSVKEYLASSRSFTRTGRFSNFAADDAEAHKRFAKICIIYWLPVAETIWKFEIYESIKLFPFARYSREFWHRHMKATTVRYRIPKPRDYVNQEDA